jgi:hypothetical protein
MLVDVNPVLAAQYSARNTVPLETVFANSGKKAWWLCDVCAYEWEAVIASRNAGRGCPSCAGKVATPKNGLTYLFPDIAKWYHPTKNKKPVEAITVSSHYKAWWFCENDHEYQAQVFNKTRQLDGCPICSGRYASKGNNLAEDNPVLAAEFDLVKNAPLTAADFTPRSSKKVWWVCKEEHSWIASILHRNRDEHDCPYCVNHTVSPTNNLLVRYPKVAAEFDLEKNQGLTSAMVMPGSSTPRWWLCKKGHSWEASPASRTGSRSYGCPECSATPRTSRIESALREGIREDSVLTGIGTEYNVYLDIRSGRNRRMAVDIHGYYEGIPIVVEYDSWWWHSGVGNKEGYASSCERDTRKTNALLNAGYLVIRVREDRSDGALPFLELSHPRLFQVPFNYLIERFDTTSVRHEMYAWLKNIVI